MRTSVAAPATLALILAVAVPGHTQQRNGPESNAHASRPSKHYFLARDAGERAMGLVRPRREAQLVINSGDSWSIETISALPGQIKPGVGMDGIVKLRKENDGGGPHSITGPHYVSGAEPGDTLEVRILKIVPKPDAFNFNLPGRDFPTVGLLAPGISRRIRPLLQARPGQDANAVQAGNHDRSATLPGNVRGRGRPERTGRQGRATDSTMRKGAPARCGRGKTARTWI